jgi:Uma2 family endonuclease
MPIPEPAYILPPREDGRDWPAQGEWTYEDYLLLPEDGKRYEVIRGCLYVTSTFTAGHQFTLLELACSLRAFIGNEKLDIILLSPFDIKLPNGIADPVEPDMMFFRRGNKPAWGSAFFEGVPDLLAEILSPETCERDRTIKLEAYEEAGVPELWLVDPDERIVEVYVLKGGKYAQLVRGGEDNEVWSSLFPDFRLKVADLFRP